MLLILAFLLLIAPAAMTLPEKDFSRAEAERMCLRAWEQGNYSHCLTYAKVMESLAGGEKGDLALSCLMQGKVMSKTGRVRAAVEKLSRAVKLSKSVRNDSLFAAAQGALGMTEAYAESDFYSAISRLTRASASAHSKGFEELYGYLSCDLAYVYYLKHDSAGLRHADEALLTAQKLNLPYLAYEALVARACHLSLAGLAGEARDCVAEAERLVRDNYFYDRARIYNLFGDLAMRSHEWKRAEGYYLEAATYGGQAYTTSVVYALLGRGRALLEDGRAGEAEGILRRALAVSKARSNAVYMDEIYGVLSRCLELSGRPEEALRAERLCAMEREKVFDRARERDISYFKCRYEDEKKQGVIRENRIEMMRKEEVLSRLLFIVVLLAASSALLLVMYAKKNRLYRSIVNHSRDSLRREDMLRARISELETREDEKYANSSLSDEKYDAIFEGLERLMNVERAFLDNDFNKERAADLLNTNRTYLSQIVNERTGLSFNNYVNDFRIDEAVRRLSDGSDDTPLKALSSELGFNSISTFYSVFKKKMGMTPAKFREIAEN